MQGKKASTTHMLNQFSDNTIQSTDAIVALLGPDDSMRDYFPLPTAEEREEWFQCWNDKKLLHSTINAMIFSGGFVFTARNPAEKCVQGFDRIRQYMESLDSRGHDEFFTSVKTRFLMRVHLPCLALHFEKPATLLQNLIKSGNKQLLERAVSIDPTVIHHPELALQISPGNSVQRRATWDLLATKLASSPKSPSRRKIIYTMSALLRWVSLAWDMRLTLSRITGLFNKHACSQKDVLIDSDIPETPDTFCKGVGRIVKQLPELNEADKTS